MVAAIPSRRKSGSRLSCHARAAPPALMKVRSASPMRVPRPVLDRARHRGHRRIRLGARNSIVMRVTASRRGTPRLAGAARQRVREQQQRPRL